MGLFDGSEAACSRPRTDTHLTGEYYQVMSDSIRAVVVLAGLAALLCGLTWRLIQIGAAAPATKPPVVQIGPSVQPKSGPTPLPKSSAPRPQDGVQALLDAAQRGDLRALLVMVKRGANINAAGADGMTPLMTLIRQGGVATETIDRLIKLGADPTAKDARGWNALTWAADRDDASTVTALLQRSTALTGQAGQALCVAASKNHVEALRALVENGVNVNTTDPDGNDALQAALKDGEADTVRYLVEHGADADRKRADGITMLMMAVARGDKEIVASVAEKAVHVDERNAKGESALMLAVRGGAQEVVSALLNAKADANAADNQQQTPLMAAAAAGNSDIADLLLDHGANTQARDGKGMSALAIARQNDRQSVVDLLLRRGVSE